MTPLTAILAAEITASGPIPFRRFMEVALYHPRHGYYRSGRDPFGKGGDFFTAAQLQPVFGILVASWLESLRAELGWPGEFTVVELGAGRSEMADALAAFRYIPVEAGYGRLPERFTGAVFANEFFDALPVDLLAARGGTWFEMRVGWNGEKFFLMEGGRAAPPQLDYARRYAPSCEDGVLMEVNLEALVWLDRIAASLERGWVAVIDYGYTARELLRFPQGTLMSYHRHAASQDVLASPGERDITAHVNFTALMDRAAELGLSCVGLQSLARTLLEVGERDQFAAALQAPDGAERARRALQLKTLLFGMGETFRTLLLAKQ